MILFFALVPVYGTAMVLMNHTYEWWEKLLD